MNRLRQGLAPRLVAWLVAWLVLWLGLLPTAPQALAQEPMLLTLLDLSADEAPARELAFEVTRALRQHPQVKFRELDETLHLGGEEAQASSLKSAELLVKSGLAKLRAGKRDAAMEDLDSAVDNYLVALALLPLELQPLAEALGYLGAAQLAAGQTKAAQASFARAVQVNPKLSLDLNAVLAKAQVAYEQAKAEVLARPKVDFEVRTTPPLARVYVNGRYMGLSPVYASGLAGPQLVVLTKHGQARKGRVVQVDAAHPGVDEALEPARRAAAWSALLGRLAELFDGAVEPADLAEGEGLAGVPYAVAIRAQGTRANMRVEVALCNLAGRQVIQRIARDLKWEGRNKAAKEAVDKLVADLLRPPEVHAGGPAPAAAPTPVYKTWWFWTIVGAAAVGSGVALWLASDSEPAPRTYAPGTGGILIQF